MTTDSVVSVLLDGIYLSDGKAHSGIANYVRHLLAGLVNDPSLAVSVLVTGEVEVPHGVLPVRVRRRIYSGRPSVYEHEVRRTFEARLHRADVFHNPNPFAPRFPPRRWVQSLHDLIPLLSDDPELATWRRWFEVFGPRYAEANAVIAVSTYAANQGIRHLGISSNKTVVIHHGVGSEFSPGPSRDPADPPYISLVGEYSRRKGFAEAFAVVGAVAEAGLPHRLKVAGRVDPSQQCEFDAVLAAAPRPDRIDLLGFVADLPDLYRGATAHLITSRHEGFGFPAVEAMACGTPVVSFDNTSLPEVIGDGGVLVEDGSIEAASRAVIGILRAPKLRTELSEVALTRSACFSWEKSIRAHADVFEAVAAS